MSDNFTNINVENYPKSMAYNDKNKEILVVNTFSDSVSVIDPQTNTTKKSFKVPHLPNDIVYDSSDNRVYLANSGNNTISVLDGTTYNETRNIKVGKTPKAVYFDNNSKTLYVTNGDNTLSVVDVANNYSVKTIGNRSLQERGFFNRPVDVTMDPKTKNIFVANYNDSTITVLSADKDYSLVKKITVGKSPGEILFDDKSRNLYVANSGSNSLSVISPDTLQVERTVLLGTDSIFYCIRRNR